MKKRNHREHLFPLTSSRSQRNGVRGKKILITRARGQSKQFATLLKKLGAEVVEYPTIEILPPLCWEGLDQAIDRLESYDWIIFTSVNGVHFFLQRLREKGRDSLPFSLKVCAIGPATARPLREKKISVDFTPSEFIAEGILEGFQKMGIKGKRILLARAKKARDILPKGLRKLGAVCEVVEVYRTVRPKGGAKRLKKLLREGGMDVITFTSSSTVNHFAELLKKEDIKKLLKGITIACIGPVTAKTATQWGMEVHIQPQRYTVVALTRAIAKYYTSSTMTSLKRPWGKR